MTGIGFSTTDAIISRLICRLAREPGLSVRDTPSHVWLLHEAYGDEYVMGAEWNGFCVVPYREFAAVNRVIDIVPVKDRMDALGVHTISRVNQAATWLGEPYDFLELVGHVAKCWRRLKSPKKMICQEAIMRAFPELFEGLSLWDATPAKCWLALRR